MLLALRRHFPQAHIAWAIERPADQLIESLPGLDELIVLRKGWLKSLSQLRHLRARLQSQRFDVTIDPQSLTRSALPAWLSGARYRIGFASGTGRELSLVWNNVQVVAEHEHVVDRTLQLLQPLGVPAHVPNSADVRFIIPAHDAARLKIGEYVRDAHLGCDFAVINPGAGWHSRRWPLKNFAVVARRLGQEQRMPSVVTWAGEDERRWAEQIVEQAGGHALLAPPTTLRDLAELMRHCRMFVGSDTGPLHIANAVGVPCVALHGTTRPECSGAYGNHHIAVQSYYQQGSARQRRRGDNEAMRAITPEMVYSACQQMLARLTLERNRGSGEQAA